MAWSDLDEVEHLPRRGLLRDGRLILFPRDGEQHVATRARAGHRPCSGADGDLTAALGPARRRPVRRSSRSCPHRTRTSRTSRTARGHEPRGCGRHRRDAASWPARRPSPLREPVDRRARRGPRRAERARGRARADGGHGADGHRGRGSPSDVPDRRPRRVPVVDPVIGPQLRAARERLRPQSTSWPSAPGSARTSSRRSRSTTSCRAAATSTPAATCAPWPGCSASTWRRCSRPTTTGTPTRRSTRAGSSRPSWPPAAAARSAAPGAARTGRSSSPP